MKKTASLFKVTRNCCTSGNCVTCSRVTQYGKPVRVVQADNLTAARAAQYAEGWAGYGAKVEPMADRP